MSTGMPAGQHSQRKLGAVIAPGPNPNMLVVSISCDTPIDVTAGQLVGASRPANASMAAAKSAAARSAE